jgi:hypothetical protein
MPPGGREAQIGQEAIQRSELAVQRARQGIADIGLRLPAILLPRLDGDGSGECSAWQAGFQWPQIDALQIHLQVGLRGPPERNRAGKLDCARRGTATQFCAGAVDLDLLEREVRPGSEGAQRKLLAIPRTGAVIEDLDHRIPQTGIRAGRLDAGLATQCGGRRLDIEGMGVDAAEFQLCMLHGLSAPGMHSGSRFDLRGFGSGNLKLPRVKLQFQRRCLAAGQGAAGLQSRLHGKWRIRIQVVQRCGEVRRKCQLAGVQVQVCQRSALAVAQTGELQGVLRAIVAIVRG